MSAWGCFMIFNAHSWAFTQPFSTTAEGFLGAAAGVGKATYCLSPTPDGGFLQQND